MLFKKIVDNIIIKIERTATSDLPGFKDYAKQSPAEIISDFIEAINKLKEEEQNARTSQRSLFGEDNQKSDKKSKSSGNRRTAPGVARDRGKAGERTTTGKGEVNEPGQNYTLEEPTKAIDFKLKTPDQLELPFGKKKSAKVPVSLPATPRRVGMRRTGSIAASGTVVENAGDALAKGIKGFSMTSTPQEKSKPLPKNKEDSSSSNLRLTPSEIESLRKHKQQISRQMRGKFDHLFKHEKREK